MVQGTSSHVGKSLMVAALCRIFLQDGFRVAPFKAQNMSNNSYVTPDGGEIGRAQAVQAEAAGIEPAVEMNPILLKPEADDRSQIVVMGRRLAALPAQAYYASKESFWSHITESLEKLLADYEIVIVEGAGSPAEVNLRENDIVNMRVARYAKAPVLLVADIDRGGVFAFLVGTLELLETDERAFIKAFVINKFRGDIGILLPGLEWLERRTGVPVAGVISYFGDIQIAEEDSVAEKPHGKVEHSAPLDVAVVCLPHISNFDDFDPLEREPDVGLRYVHTAHDLGTPDMVIVPGTKTTVADLEWLQTQGIAAHIRSLARNGTAIMGICGGYQILGERILDPEGLESTRAEVRGLGLLPVATAFAGTKETHRVKGDVRKATGLLRGASGLPIEGYEIHMGRSYMSPNVPDNQDIAYPFQIRERSGHGCDRPDGTIDSSGYILGTYIHGLFHNSSLRKAVLEGLAERKGVSLSASGELEPKGDKYDKLAGLVRGSLDMSLVYRIMGLRPHRV